MVTQLSDKYHTIYLPSEHCLSERGDQYFRSLLTLVDVVSFDLFDTLIQREGVFFPKDLFYRVQEQTERRLNLRIDNFASVRVRAEQTARVRARGHGSDETILDDIYIELGRMLNLETDIIQRVQEVELDCERSALTALKSGKRLYETALAAGKTVVIITDTYFDEKFISELIKLTGYSRPSKVYVSSKCGKTKSEGSLYDIFLQEFQCAPGRILHVGDNNLSDVTMPLSKGIRAFNIYTPKHRLKWHRGLSDMQSGDTILSAMLCEVSQRSSEGVKTQGLQSVLAKTGTQQLSLLYYAVAAWLVHQLRESGYERVFFSARDGLIMKRFFDLVASAAGLEIDSRYLYVSRTALYPTLIFTDPETARCLFCHSWENLPIEKALGRLSLTNEETADALANHGLTDSSVPLNASTISMFSSLLTDIWPLLEQKFRESYKLAAEYLHQEMVLNEEKTAYVDIGWHGSVQNCVLKMLRSRCIDHRLSGFYLGTFQKPVGVDEDFKALGYLLNNDEPQDIRSVVRSGPSVIELFFSAGHGTVLGYKREGSRVVPVLQDNPVEQEQFEKIIAPVQNHAFSFVSAQLDRLRGLRIMSPEAGVAARTALHFLYDPTIEEARTFGRLRIASDFGGPMKSITGALEFDLNKITGDTLPNGKFPMWRPGFNKLRNS